MTLKEEREEQERIAARYKRIAHDAIQGTIGNAASKEFKLSEEQTQQIESVTIAAFQKDLSQKRTNDQGFEEVLAAIAELSTSKGGQLNLEERERLKNFYNDCKKDYQDTHLLGVGKESAHKKIKALGGMIKRFSKSCVAAGATISGVTALVVTSPITIAAPKKWDLMNTLGKPAKHGSLALAELNAKNRSAHRFAKEFRGR